MHHSYNEYELIIPLQYSHILTSQALQQPHSQYPLPQTKGR